MGSGEKGGAEKSRTVELWRVGRMVVLMHSAAAQVVVISDMWGMPGLFGLWRVRFPPCLVRPGRTQKEKGALFWRHNFCLGEIKFSPASFCEHREDRDRCT